MPQGLRKAKSIFGFHVLLGNPKSGFQTANSDFPANESTLQGI